VSGQLHAPAALPPGIEVGWTPEPLWTTWSKNSWPYRGSNSDPLVIQPVASRYTDYAIIFLGCSTQGRWDDQDVCHARENWDVHTQILLGNLGFSIDPHFLDLCTSWRVISFTPRPLYPRERAPGTHCIGCWMDPRAVWTMWRSESACLHSDSNSDLSVVQPAATRYTDWSTPHTPSGHSACLVTHRGQKWPQYLVDLVPPH
jgi:hypothetical protein